MLREFVGSRVCGGAPVVQQCKWVLFVAGVYWRDALGGPRGQLYRPGQRSICCGSLAAALVAGAIFSIQSHAVNDGRLHYLWVVAAAICKVSIGFY